MSVGLSSDTRWCHSAGDQWSEVGPVALNRGDHGFPRGGEDHPDVAAVAPRSSAVAAVGTLLLVEVAVGSPLAVVVAMVPPLIEVAAATC
ncbi:hypothetical protein KFL_013090010 [Klebsormidium nitens]|uniref:Uncharacterized protein n=1 Tax=Klebsormidium nitens TaxID=105231 RepID=A0A1Y1IXU3_KLENI|nr:hypothetical protein KFL_013090010 [Klebsormidium nitens]|eukprot:GAQ93118.1 hypothetical protein KFL_013090010 [Klebsormidium nitens]